MIKVPWWKKIALYLLTHGEQNRLELQSWREEKVGIKSWIWKTLLMIWIIYLCNHNLAKVIEEVMDRMVEFHNLMPKCAEIKSQILQSWFRSVRELLIQLIIRQSSSQGTLTTNFRYHRLGDLNLGPATLCACAGGEQQTIIKIVIHFL